MYFNLFGDVCSVGKQCFHRIRGVCDDFANLKMHRLSLSKVPIGLDALCECMCKSAFVSCVFLSLGFKTEPLCVSDVSE